MQRPSLLTRTKCSEEIPADLKPTDTAIPPNVSFSFKMLPIFPNIGTSICLAGPRHLKLLDIHPENLILCNKLVSAVGGSKLLYHGWVPTTFCINNQQTNQPLFLLVIKLTEFTLLKKAAQLLIFFHLPSHTH